MENRLGDVSRGTTDSSTASAQPGPLEIHGAPPCISLLWDESAFDQLYEKYSPTVYAVAVRVLEDPSSAEDVLQDVFLRVWSRPACLAVAQKNPRKWLETISRNVRLICSGEGIRIMQFTRSHPHRQGIRSRPSNAVYCWIGPDFSFADCHRCREKRSRWRSIWN
jgi:hypothetical protein